MKPLGLGYVGINTTNPAAWSVLGAQVLGLQGADAGDGSLRFRLDERMYRLAVHASDVNGLAYAGWEYMDRRALEEAGDQLAHAGTTVEAATREEADSRGVGGLLRCQDPCGNHLELFYGAEEDGVTPFVSPRHGVSFVTAEQGLGHLVYSVTAENEFAAMADFYSRSLGFQVTDFMARTRVGLDMTFLGCNSRHHSIAVMRAGFTGFQHMMLEVTDLASAGQAYDMCQDGAAPVVTTLGQHWNDRMTSFTIMTPSQFRLEYGWGGRRINRATHAAVQSEAQTVVWGHRRSGPATVN